MRPRRFLSCFVVSLLAVVLPGSTGAQPRQQDKGETIEAKAARARAVWAELEMKGKARRSPPALIGVGSVGKLHADTALRVAKLVSGKEGYVESAGDLYLVHTDFGKLKAGDFLNARGLVECTGKHEITDLVSGRKRIVFEWWIYDN